MKRKVKFQEGGAVEEPARRPAPRSRLSRMSAAARNRFSEARAASQREVERLNAMRDVEEFNRSRQVAEANRRAGLPSYPAPGSQDFTTDTRGTTRRGAATGREVVPFQEPGTPARPSASRALAEVATPRQMPLGRVRPPIGGGLATVGGALAAEAIEPMVNYGREYAARRGAEADARRELNLLSMRARTADAEGGDIAADAERQRQEANRPAPRPASRPAAPRPAPAPAPRPRVREMTADELNDMELRRIRAERQMEEDDARERLRRREEMMGGSGNIGAASARERGEQVGPPGQYNMKKGGIVKKKAGGMVKAKPVAKKAGGMVKSAPKKMMKGGIVAKPKSKAKPMPAFKKGGVVKKGKK